MNRFIVFLIAGVLLSSCAGGGLTDDAVAPGPSTFSADPNAADPPAAQSSRGGLPTGRY